MDMIAPLDGKCVTGGWLNIGKVLNISTDALLVYKAQEIPDDGIVNPGETVELTVTLGNIGLQAADVVTGH